MARTQFTFYESFYTALSCIRKKADKSDAYDAICRYALFNEWPDFDTLSDAGRIAFTLVKPNLDAAKRKSDGGKKNEKIIERCDEDSEKIPERYAEDGGNKKKKEKEIENKKEKEIEKEIENECYLSKKEKERKIGFSAPADGEYEAMKALLDEIRGST